MSSKGKRKGGKRKGARGGTSVVKGTDAPLSKAERRRLAREEAANPKAKGKGKGRRRKGKREDSDDEGAPADDGPKLSKKEQLEEEEKGLMAPKQAWPYYVYLKGSAYDSSKSKRRAYSARKDIQVKNFDLGVGSLTLMRDTDLSITFGQKYGLVGRNGIGKSVLLRNIAARTGPFEDVPEWITILLVEQEIAGDELTPLQSVLKADRERDWLVKEAARLEAEEKAKAAEAAKKEDADDAEEEDSYDDEEDDSTYTLRDIHERLREIDSSKAPAKAASILAGLGFQKDEMDTKKTKDYSGGWRMRISLARALFVTPDLLMLDEPTNHLDLNAVIWLEEYLQRYKKTILVASHERSFLENCVENIIHLNNETLTRYRGAYAAFEKARGQNLRATAKRKKIADKKTKELKTKQRSGRTKKQKAKELARINTVRTEKKDPHLSFEFPDPETDLETAVITMDEASFRYAPDSELIFEGVNIGIYADSKIGLVGSNGVGKSTLMKLLATELEPTAGKIWKNGKLRLARFHQHHMDQLDSTQSSAVWLRSKFPDSKEETIRKQLGKFGLGGKMATRPMGTLSGGQKSRAVLAFLTMTKPHLLFLDEPTNHLDIDAIDALVAALKEFKGALVIISHNQYLIEEACEELWVVGEQNAARWKKKKAFSMVTHFANYKEYLVDKLFSEADF